MALRTIVKQGDECLQKVCRPVTEFNSRLHTLLDDMTETLLDSGGVGLAAPQVGVLRRVCVVMNEDEEIIELVNPEIVATEGEQTGLEGCLSVPGRYGIVRSLLATAAGNMNMKINVPGNNSFPGQIKNFNIAQIVEAFDPVINAADPLPDDQDILPSQRCGRVDCGIF